MRGILIRVGIDMGSGGTLGPIFDEGTFEFIPIPEEEAGVNPRNWPTYAGIPARTGGVLADFIPPRLRSWIPHADPEFQTPSYGDPTTKSRSLRKLTQGDVLFFHAGLRPRNASRFPPRANYIIGYLTIDRIVDFRNLNQNGEQFTHEWTALQNNFHLGFRGERNTFIVVGIPARSRLLQRAYPFTELRPDKTGHPTVAIRHDLEELLGISGFVQRSTPRFLSVAGTRWLLEELGPFE